MNESTKQMMNQRSLLILVAGLIFSFLLVGCATGDIPEIDDPPEVETTAEQKPTATALPENTPTQIPEHLLVEPDDLAGVEVRFVHPWMGAVAETIESITEDFSRTNPWGLMVTVEAFGSEFLLLDSLRSALDADEEPELLALHPYLLMELSGDIQTIDLSDYFNHPEWGFEGEAQADLIPVFLEPYAMDGSLIALPVMPQAYVLFYNQTWADELGYSSPPDDQIEFQDVSCAASFVNWRDENPASDGTGGWVMNLDPNVLAAWYRVFGGELPFDVTPSFNDDAAQVAFRYLWTAREQGCFWIARDPEPYFYFSSRFALAYAGTLDQISSQMGWLEMTESEDEWITIGFPGPADDQIIVDGPSLLVTTGAPEHQLAAWLFARHLLEPEVQAQLITSGFTLPIRRSALDYLDTFADDYPQWSQAVSLLDSAQAVPASQGWGIARWVLQDAVFRMLQTDVDEIPQRLEELDQKVRELEGFLP